MTNLQGAKFFDLPEWVGEFCEKFQLSNDRQITPSQAMEIAIALSDWNTRYQTGGPFGSVIRNNIGGRIVALGVNRVVPCRCSLLHGETVAIAMAQEAVGSFSLAGDKGLQCELYTSAAPCAMCVGAIAWAGLTQVICAARSTDVEELVGFDEGPIHPKWIEELKSRGILVGVDFQREAACEVLRAYKESGAVVYNADALV